MPLGAPAAQLSLSGQTAAQAEFIVTNLQHTDYQHVSRIDVDRGVYDCDCNGFVSFVLERAAPGHYVLVPKEPNQSRPRAFEYYVFFNSLEAQSENGWHQITHLMNARRGDLIAWRFPKIEKGHDTGHVVFVAETPVMDDSGILSVRVYDSSADPHFDDTRGSKQGEFATGVGSGVIQFKTDETGRPISFQFGPSKPHFTELPIAIGRLEPLPA